MSKAKPFIVHKNQRFKNLLKKLISLRVVHLLDVEGGDVKQIEILKPHVLIDVFRFVFFLYANPTHKQHRIDFCRKTVRLIVRGDFCDYAFIEPETDDAKQIIEALVTKESDEIYEECFNALIAIHLASFKYTSLVFPNTYITDLGNDTHEIDVIMKTQNGLYIIVETTRGFNKDVDGVDESYSWHFKKAVFRKWLIEKFFDVECKLFYLTLKSFGRSSEKSEVATELANELSQLDSDNNPEHLDGSDRSLTGNKLIDVLLEKDPNIRLLDLGRSLGQSLDADQLANLLQNQLIDKLQSLLNDNE